MNAYIRAGGLPEHYRCESDIETNWQKEDEADYIFGSACLIFGIVCEVLYIPCIIAFLQKDLFVLPVYKFFLFITVFDMINLITNSILTGIFLSQGAVFCSYPHFMYIWGCIQVASWGGCCIGCFFLVLTRIVDAIDTDLYNKLFAGRRIYFSIVFMLLYVMAFMFYGKSITFNSHLKAWIFDPLIYGNKDYSDEYFSYLMTGNNLLTVTLTCFMGIAFFLTFWFRIKQDFAFKLKKRQKQIMIQSTILSINTFINAIIFVSFQFIEVSLTVSLAEAFTWQLSSASGIFIYYFMNSTVRNRISQLFEKYYRTAEVSSITLRNPAVNRVNII